MDRPGAVPAKTKTNNPFTTRQLLNFSTSTLALILSSQHPVFLGVFFHRRFFCGIYFFEEEDVLEAFHEVGDVSVGVIEEYEGGVFFYEAFHGCPEAVPSTGVVYDVAVHEVLDTPAHTVSDLAAVSQGSVFEGLFPQFFGQDFAVLHGLVPGIEVEDAGIYAFVACHAVVSHIGDDQVGVPPRPEAEGAVCGHYFGSVGIVNEAVLHVERFKDPLVEEFREGFSAHSFDQKSEEAVSRIRIGEPGAWPEVEVPWVFYEELQHVFVVGFVLLVPVAFHQPHVVLDSRGVVQQVSYSDVIPGELGDVFVDAVVDIDQPFMVQDEGGGCGKCFADAGQLEGGVGLQGSMVSEVGEAEAPAEDDLAVACQEHASVEAVAKQQLRDGILVKVQVVVGEARHGFYGLCFGC